ncbi:uncharacterized protein [Palaemon carinicauda]|uniref:uncharacterized protein n=1 Tax=Palaemon carinicauda TaxID=392227 RepID=UPI0035B5F04B
MKLEEDMTQGKSKEEQKPIFLIFYNLEKAYDSIPRTAMWSVLKRFGIPEPFVDMVRVLHDGMTAKGVEIKYRLGGGIFKLFRIKSQRNTNTINVTELQYADDNAAVAHTQAELQESVDNFHAAYTCFGLTVNKAKTKILVQPRPRKNPPATNITMDGTIIECGEHFPYLGSILPTQSISSKEIENRLQAGCTA